MIWGPQIEFADEDSARVFMHQLGLRENPENLSCKDCLVGSEHVCHHSTIRKPATIYRYGKDLREKATCQIALVYY